MPVSEFPPLELADKHGLLAIGGDLAVETLVLAYSNGIFPWPFEEESLAWFAPPQRAVLFLKDLHVARSLLKFQKTCSWKFTFDQAFKEVIKECAAPINRGSQNGTWITRDIIKGYTDFHLAGYAHSCKCWEGSTLVAGLYCVNIGKFFAAESMFYRKPNASKLSLLFLLKHLQAQGVEWVDCQQLNPVTKAFGAKNIKRDKFMSLLKAALEKESIKF